MACISILLTGSQIFHRQRFPKVDTNFSSVLAEETWDRTVANGPCKDGRVDHGAAQSSALTCAHTSCLLFLTLFIPSQSDFSDCQCLSVHLWVKSKDCAPRREHHCFPSPCEGPWMKEEIMGSAQWPWGAGIWIDAVKGKELTLSEESFSDQGNHSKANKTMISSMWEPVYCEAVLGRTRPRHCPPGPAPLPPLREQTQNRRKVERMRGYFSQIWD